MIAFLRLITVLDVRPVQHSSNSIINQLNDFNIPELYFIWPSKLLKIDKPQLSALPRWQHRTWLMHVPVAMARGDDDCWLVEDECNFFIFLFFVVEIMTYLTASEGRTSACLRHSESSIFVIWWLRKRKWSLAWGEDHVIMKAFDDGLLMDTALGWRG